jgi:hypothetical protein
VQTLIEGGYGAFASGLDAYNEGERGWDLAGAIAGGFVQIQPLNNSEGQLIRKL